MAHFSAFLADLANYPGSMNAVRGRYAIAGTLTDDYQKRKIYSHQVGMEATPYAMEVVKKVSEPEGYLG